MQNQIISVLPVASFPGAADVPFFRLRSYRNNFTNESGVKRGRILMDNIIALANTVTGISILKIGQGSPLVVYYVSALPMTVKEEPTHKYLHLFAFNGKYCRMNIRCQLIRNNERHSNKRKLYLGPLLQSKRNA